MWLWAFVGIKIVIVATIVMIILSVSLFCSHTKTATAIGTATTIPIPDTPIGGDLGLDVNVIPDIKRKTQYYGGTAYIGVAPPIAGFGVHGAIGYTWSMPININVFNIYEGLYVLLMES